MLERTFIFYPEWLDLINMMEQDEDKLDLYNMIVLYGCQGIETSSKNSVVTAVFKTLIKPKIDIAQKHYEERVNAGKTYGRKRKVDDEQVKALAQQGMKAKDIAIELDVSADAIYHSDGWKNRNL